MQWYNSDIVSRMISIIQIHFLEIKIQASLIKILVVYIISYSMKWKAYTVEIEDDEESQVGKKEKLEELMINETIPSYASALLDVPSRVFEYGLHKLVFRFEIETGNEDIPMYKEAFTYINITKSPLMPVLIEGSASKVSRGWRQALALYPGQLSVDPDYPEDKVLFFK